MIYAGGVCVAKNFIVLYISLSRDEEGRGTVGMKKIPHSGLHAHTHDSKDFRNKLMPVLLTGSKGGAQHEHFPRVL